LWRSITRRLQHVLHNFTIAKQQLAPGPGGNVVLVRDDHHCHALRVELREQLHDVFTGFGIERASGLVGQNQLRLVHQRAGNGYALLLPARQLRGRVRTALAQTHPVQRGLCAQAPLGRTDPGIQHGQGHVLQRAGARQQVELLKHKTNAPVAYGRELVLRHSVDRFTGQVVMPARGQIQTTQNIHQGGLARTRGAHDGDKLAFGNVQRHAAQRVHGLVTHGVGLDEVACLDQRVWGSHAVQNGMRGPDGPLLPGLPVPGVRVPVITRAPSLSSSASGALGESSNSVLLPSVMPRRTL
jgi:hypothetical protein